LEKKQNILEMRENSVAPNIPRSPTAAYFCLPNAFLTSSFPSLPVGHRIAIFFIVSVCFRFTKRLPFFSLGERIFVFGIYL
jgi:hypothetical protein